MERDLQLQKEGDDTKRKAVRTSQLRDREKRKQKDRKIKGTTHDCLKKEAIQAHYQEKQQRYGKDNLSVAPSLSSVEERKQKVQVLYQDKLLDKTRELDKIGGSTPED